MDVLPQTCLQEDVPRIPPLLNFSTLTMSFTGALPRKMNTFPYRGSLCFVGEMRDSEKRGNYSAPKPHIDVNKDLILLENMLVCVTHAYTICVMRECPALPVCGTLS